MMADPKPLSFGDSTPKSGAVGGKALQFAESPKVLKPASPPSTPAVKVLNFDNVVSPVIRPRASAPSDVHVRIAVDPKCVSTLDRLRQNLGNAEYTKVEMRAVSQVGNLIPITIQKVTEWGVKSLERMRASVREAQVALEVFTELQARETIEAALEAVKPQQPKGFFSWASTPVDPSKYEAALQMIINQAPTQVAAIGPHQKACEENRDEIAFKLAVIVALVENIGTISDNQLDQAFTNRRVVLSQGIMQCDLTIQQLKNTIDLIGTLRTSAEQLLNFTIPQFKATKGRS